MKQSFVWKLIRGHHVYRDIWTPVKDETVLCMEDDSWTPRLSRYMDTPVKDETVLCMEVNSWTPRLSRYMDTS